MLHITSHLTFDSLYFKNRFLTKTQPRPQGFSLKNPFFEGKALGTRLTKTSKRATWIQGVRPGPCVRKIVLVGILWTLKFLCRNLQFKWCWIEKKLSAIFSAPFTPVLCKLDMTSLYSWWMTTKCLQFDSRLFESNIINAYIIFI